MKRLTKILLLVIVMVFITCYCNILRNGQRHYSFHLQHNSYWCGTCYWRSANLLACTSAYWQQIHHCNSICYPHHLGNNFLLCLGRSSRNNTYSILRCVLHFARKTQSTHCRRNVTNNYTSQQCCTQMLIFDNIVLQY